jgi:hypothetical protein
MVKSQNQRAALTLQDKKTRRKKSPKAKLHNTSYRNSHTKTSPQTKAVSYNWYYVK